MHKMFHFSRRAKLLFAFFALVAAGYVGVLFVGRANGIPPSFSEARLQGALIAQNIVNLSNESADDLKEINALSSEGKYPEALNVVLKTIEKSKEIRDEAVRLSGEMEKMTKALSEIDSAEARQAALESISNRLALLSRLINYSGYLSNLLEGLRDGLLGKRPVGEITALVNQVNAEVIAINNFNAQAGQAMDRFDAILKK